VAEQGVVRLSEDWFA